MLLFDLQSLMLGDIVAVRAYHTYSRVIRGIIGSYTNHDGKIVRATGEALAFLAEQDLLDKDWPIAPGDLCIGEAIQPRSTLTSIPKYEAEMNKAEDPCQVRVWRVPEEDTTPQERQAVNDLFLTSYLGLKYPIGVARLWVMRFVNQLPWKIKGPWCTRIVWEPWECIVPGVFDRPPDGKRKKNPTPRTFENRLAAGVIRDVTPGVIVSKAPRP